MRDFLLIFCALFFGTSGMYAQAGLEVKTLVTNFDGNGAVTVTPKGTVLVNEYGTANADISGSGTRIFEVSNSGEVQIYSDKVHGAIGGAFDESGTFYFNNRSSMGTSELTRYKDGKLLKLATLKGFAADMIIDSENHFLLVTNYTEPVISKIDFDGNVSDFVTDERLKGCTGIVKDGSGTLYVSNFTSGKIFKIDLEGKISEFAQVPTVYAGYVIGYITYYKDTLYATGYGAGKIYKIDRNGVVEDFAGTGTHQELDGPSKEAQFVVPNGIDVDLKKGRLYISQNGNGKPAGLRYIDLD